MNCPACSNLIVHGDRFCSSCGQALDELPTTTKEPTPHVARATTSVDYLHGRFSPGSILGRYRIVERVGKGGMGEVYHADDLTLNQPVALKFLPEELAQNERALKRFRSEVRTARQISHPNVCRVYDIGEVEGLQFLSMEYIQGEDLRSLLRRIDHLPPGKAVEIAVQLASGLAAAHDKGVLHRDLKPANVMIDERGQARIADFGLAALAGAVETRDIGSGTPSYMAPEQRAGKEVTERSDIYSLGLVLYEAFTGRRAFEGLEQKDTAIAAPSSFVDGIDPALERIILQCLEREPKKRPSSALAIRAALPGGDPLAAAVARGETPAPAIVAEAGAFSGLSPAVAWTCLLSVLFSLAGTLWIAGQSRLSQIVPLPESPAFLIADARSILEDLGYPTPQRDSTYGFSRDVSYIDDLMSKDRSSTWWELLERGEPSVIRFWYRESPQNLVPHRITEFFPAQHDPPDSLPGMVSIELDTRGRLRRLEAVPPDLTDSADDTNEPDWGALFAAASLDPENFSPVEPRWFPPRYADRRAAWDGIYPDAPEIPIRVEAASFHGRAVAFRIVEPWSAPAAGAGAESPWVRPSDVVPNRWASVAHVGLHLLFMFTLALLARRNLKLGRGDRRLAFRLGAVLFAVVMLHWIFGAHHVPERSQLQLFFGALYRAFFSFGLAWLFYISLEPYARKLWPRTMISWVRLLDGRFRDPLVGRDVLLGCVYGIGIGFLNRVLWLAPTWLGDGPPPRPDLPHHPAELIALRGVSESLSQIFANFVNISTHILFLIVALLLLRFVFRKTWLAVGIHGALYVFIYSSGFGFLGITLWICVWYVVFFRFGWVSILVGTFTNDLLHGFPLTTNPTVWYAHAPILAVLVCMALAVYGFKVSLGGRPAFKDLLAET